MHKTATTMSTIHLTTITYRHLHLTSKYTRNGPYNMYNKVKEHPVKKVLYIVSSIHFTSLHVLSLHFTNFTSFHFIYFTSLHLMIDDFYFPYFVSLHF
jgi:hypothetical protein